MTRLLDLVGMSFALRMGRGHTTIRGIGAQTLLQEKVDHVRHVTILLYCNKVAATPMPAISCGIKCWTQRWALHRELQNGGEYYMNFAFRPVDFERCVVSA